MKFLKQNTFWKLVLIISAVMLAFQGKQREAIFCVVSIFLVDLIDTIGR